MRAGADPLPTHDIASRCASDISFLSLLFAQCSVHGFNMWQHPCFGIYPPRLLYSAKSLHTTSSKHVMFRRVLSCAVCTLWCPHSQTLQSIFLSCRPTFACDSECPAPLRESDTGMWNRRRAYCNYPECACDDETFDWLNRAVDLAIHLQKMPEPASLYLKEKSCQFGCKLFDGASRYRLQRRDCVRSKYRSLVERDRER